MASGASHSSFEIRLDDGRVTHTRRRDRGEEGHSLPIGKSFSRFFSFWVTNPDTNLRLVFGPDEAVSVARGASYSYFSIRLDDRRV